MPRDIHAQFASVSRCSADKNRRARHDNRAGSNDSAGSAKSATGRNESDALATFVTAFLQSEELGAPLAPTLHQIAADMRRDSAQRMRRRAARVAPRVTLVTSLVLVPGALILVIVVIVLGSGVDFAELFGDFG